MESRARPTEQGTLVQAFHLFEQASSALQAEYSHLHREVARLRAEVGEKNAQLERGMEEHRRWRLFLAEIIEQMPKGIVVADASGAVIGCNGAAERLMGLAESPAPGTPLASLGKIGDALADDLRREGTDRLTAEGPRGDTRRFKIARTPLPDHGAGGARLLVIEDVTDEQLISERAERAGRLTSTGEMAARIAHEIRNPLTSCRLFLEMASRDVRAGSGDDALLNLEKLEGVLGAIECTVSNTLAFVRNHRPSASPFDPEAAIRECLDQVGPLLSERRVSASVENRIPGETAVSDPALLRQVFLNILLNAVQAMRDGGSISIALSLRRVRKGDREEPYLRFAFRDTGAGIPVEVQPRIFDPFFTTRAEGTGLGLTVVQSILLALDGFAEVQSRVGDGTTFSVLIPRHPAVDGAAQ